MAVRKGTLSWLLIVAINLATFAALAHLFISATEKYIQEKRQVTLLYDINALRRQVLVPEQQYEKRDVRIHINSLGMRGDAPGMSKPEGTCRVFAMGGSSAFDHKLTQGQSWPERLAGLLAGAGVVNVESFNAGVPGYSSRETLAFYHDVIRYLRPDVVIFYNGWNDVKYMTPFREGLDVDSFYHICFRPVANGLRACWLRRLLLSLTNLAQKAHLAVAPGFSDRH